MRALHQLWEPLGEWRTRLLMRLYGLCLLDYALIALAGGDFADMVVTRAVPQFYGLAACGLLLLIAGARLISIAITWAWTLTCFGLLLSGENALFTFPAAEWTIFVLIPLFACGVPVIAMARAVRTAGDGGDLARRYRAEVDWGITAVFRVMAIHVLGFAALHKLNSDFFDPNVSCIALEERLTRWWGLPPAFYRWFGSVHVVTAEALAPLLLAFAPWVGIAFTVGLVSIFASIGAPAFAGLVITMALAFMPSSAHAALREGTRRFWPFMLLCVLGVLAARMAYRARFPWLPLAITQSLAVLTLWCCGFFAADHLRLRRHASTARAQPNNDGSRAAPGIRAWIACMALVCTFNGMTPYLGLKFQYSFAMLSNLRVDDERWNSLIFPRWLRLTAHDDFVHVARSRYRKLPSGPVMERAGLLDPGMYSPTAVRYVLRRSIESRVQISLDFDYRGRSHRFVDSADPMRLYAFAASLPHTPLIQKRVDGRRPQSCLH